MERPVASKHTHVHEHTRRKTGRNDTKYFKSRRRKQREKLTSPRSWLDVFDFLLNSLYASLYLLYLEMLPQLWSATESWGATTAAPERQNSLTHIHAAPPSAQLDVRRNDRWASVCDSRVKLLTVERGNICLLSLLVFRDRLARNYGMRTDICKSAKTQWWATLSINVTSEVRIAGDLLSCSTQRSQSGDSFHWRVRTFRVWSVLRVKQWLRCCLDSPHEPIRGQDSLWLRCNRSQFPGICQINSQSLFVFMHNVHTCENRCLQLENMWQHSQSTLRCFFDLCEDLKEKGWAFFQRGDFLFNVGNFIAKWGAFWIFGKWRIFSRSGHVSKAGGFLKG